MRTSRSRRRSALDDALASLRILPYRCGDCSFRFRSAGWIRALGDKPWLADSRAPVIGRRWVDSSPVWPVALLSSLIIALIGASAAALLHIIRLFAPRLLAF